MFEKLIELSAPQHRELAEFVRGCSTDPSTRTMATTALVLTLWQMAGRHMTSQLPSMLLVNAGDAKVDHIDTFINEHATGWGSGPKRQTEGAFAHGSPENARTAMITAARLANEYQRDAAAVASWTGRYHAARVTGYGSKRTNGYARAWDESLGWITHNGDHVILRLDSPEDREAFRSDVVGEDHRKLLHPEGFGRALDRTGKALGLSGSLTPDLWDATLVGGLMRLGLPVFFLPHVADGLKAGNSSVLNLLSTTMSNPRFLPVEPSIHLLPIDWIEHYEQLLRQRLHHLPAAYEASILRAVHELGGVCWNIARQAAPAGSPKEEVFAVHMDLQTTTMRGIVIGVTALAYHCRGFAPGCPREEALKLLQHLRLKGTLTRRGLQRKFRRFTAEQLGKVLERLATEGLVELEGRKVTALPPEDFVRTLHARPEFIETKLLWPVLMDGMGS